MMRTLISAVLSAMFAVGFFDGPMAASAQEENYIAVSHGSGVIFLRESDLASFLEISTSPLRAILLESIPARRRLYVVQDAGTHATANAGLSIDTCSGALLPPIVATTPVDITSNADGSLLYLSNYRTGQSFTVVDTSNNAVVAVVPTPFEWPTFVVFDPDNDDLYVSVHSMGSNNGVWKYNGSTFEDEGLAKSGGVNGFAVVQGVIYSHTGDKGIFDMKRSADGKHLLLLKIDGTLDGSILGAVIQKIDVTTGSIVSDIHVSNNGSGAFVWKIAFSPDETKAYLPFRAGELDELVVIDMQTGAVLQRTPLPVDPFDVAWVGPLGATCGNGQRDPFCEECDDGNNVDGDGCDSNCTTTACGNGILTGMEQCDDGNSSNQDGCKHDCTVNVCGDGVIHIGVERCDDGNLTDGDGCEADCTLPPETVDEPVGAGGTLSTDTEADGATAADPVETSVTTPNAGTVSITEGALDPATPGGFTFLGQAVHISAPAASPTQPLVILLRIDATLLPEGADEDAVELSKDGALILGCNDTSGTANPDPCVSARALLSDGDVEVTLLSTSASEWGMLTPLHDTVVGPLKALSMKVGEGKFAVSRVLRVAVHNVDSNGPNQLVTLKASRDVSCPAGIVAAEPDFDQNSAFIQPTLSLRATKKATAKVSLQGLALTTNWRNVPRRCTLTFTSETLIAGNVDPTPQNSRVILDVDVVNRDAVLPPATGEYLVQPLNPKQVKIRRGETTGTASTKVLVENLGQQDVTITATSDDGDCPTGTIGAVDFDRASSGTQSSVSVGRGRRVSGVLQIVANAADFQAVSKKSPGRCSAIVALTSAGWDEDPANNRAYLNVDVLDENDF